MPQAHPGLVSFAAGEWSPNMEGRVDLENYRQSCRTLENFICLPQGPAMSRPGFKFINEVKSSLAACRLIPFIHSNEQAYMLEAGNLYFRFYMDQARIMLAGVPYEIVTPYTTAQLSALQFTQSADVCYICHGDQPQYKLSRSGHTSWSLDQVAFSDGPYLDENADQLVHLIPSATTGVGITITATNMYGLSTLSTWTGTPGADTAVMTVAVEKGGFQFEAPGAGLLKSFKVSGGGSVADPNVATAYLYSDVAGSPGALLDTSSNTQSMVAVGEKEWTFADYPLVSGTTYWICFDVATPDNGIVLATVANDADYGSGTHATTITSITNNLAAGVDWKAIVTYQPTGGASIFEAGHVGSSWRIRHTGSTTTSTFTSVTNGTAKKLLGRFIVDITVDTAWIGRIALQRSYNQVTWHDAATFSTSTKQEFVELTTGVYYRLACQVRSAGQATAALVQVEQNGVFQITGFVSASQVTATVLADFGSTDPSPFWREAAWSGVRGYPVTSCFHDDRLVFAGTEYQPLTIWMSDVGDYEQFSPDSGAMTLTLVKMQSPIQWMVAHKAFALGSAAEEATLATRKAEAITATNPPYVDVQSTFGTQLNTVPIKAGPALVFIQAGGRMVRQFMYNFSIDSFVSDDLTFLADHVSEGGLVELAYQQTPHSLLWGRTSTGDLACSTYARIGEDISKGWHRHPSDGILESISVIPAGFTVADGRHELWAIWNRTINGETKRYIEVLADNYGVTDQEDYFCVDCGLTYDGAAATTISGLDHLEGESVAIFADGAPLAQQTVVSGDITLEEAASVVQAGLPFSCTLKTQRIEAGAGDGTAQGRTKELAGVVLRLKDSIGGQVGPDEDNLVYITDFISRNDLADTAVDIFTGDTDKIPWPGNAETEGSVMIVQNDPCPITVRAIFPDLVCND